MNSKALLIGGLLPTGLLGIGTVLMKLSMREGASVANYLAYVGGAVLLVGLVASFAGGHWVSTPRAGLFAIAMGLVWSAAIGATACAASTLAIPVSILSPLTNSNAAVALLASALVFNECSELSMPRVLTGTACIVVGAIIASTAKA